ncbi:Alpha-xylosidase [Caprobacter fermentans]|uniref:alpha-D-xyloside xylohydrolase n=1 Tax=Caproicibacter fermentans TaxID=2576756 RepID=A0A6N8I2Y4_9FIRM|nr:alpha-xylosidase [Caproicibacter fermentans]MVB12299.1 Alpha-xylosidase [Caproicibacter fermentans]
MKFTDGYWLNKPGVQFCRAVQVRDVQVEKGRVTVYAADLEVTDRGQTLNRPLLTIRFSSPKPDVLRVEAVHFAGTARKEPRFGVQDEHCELETEQTEDEIRITSGKLTAVLSRSRFRVRYFFDGRLLTATADRPLAYVTAPWGEFMLEQLGLDIGEKLYGLGERFTPFVKNGQTVDLWNADGGTSSDLAYKNVPFYLSNRGYGVFVNSTDRVSYEIASETVSCVQFSVPGQRLEYMVVGGENMKGALQNYTALTGRPALPPAWSFGLWLTTSFTTQYDEKTVNSFVDGMAERNIPLRVFHFDCFWMKEYEWCNFEWDPEVFSDVRGMLARLKRKGLNICVWINPYIAQKSALFEEGMRNGYFLKRPNGDVWQWDLWQAGMAIVDFTNPAACDWYCGKLQKLIDLGVDSFKTDFGERIPTDVLYFDGSDPAMMHNYYTQLYNRTVFGLLRKNFGENNAVLFARSATAGGQQYPVHWGGDCAAKYSSMAESLRGGLSLCLSGFGFWSHDISGFESTATPDLYKRWTAFGLLSTHSRLHGSGSYRVPWLFDSEAVDVLRFFTELKCRLMPYLYSMACATHETGLPCMRAMVLEFPDDRTCEVLDQQYMLGDSLLVAPVFREDGTAEYYLPKGKWTHLLSNEVVDGGTWLKGRYDYFSLPLFVRPNTILALGKNDQKPDYDYSDGLTLHLFELSGTEPVCTEIVNQDGSPLLRAEAERIGNQVTLRWKGKTTNLRVLLRNVPKVSDLSGATEETTNLGTLLTVDPSCSHLTFTLEKRSSSAAD